MPINTRQTTPIPRSYLHDPRLARVKNPLSRETFFRMKLSVDNAGRMPGNAEMAAGILFPMNRPKPKEMGEVLTDLRDVGLIFWFKVGQDLYIEICDTGETQHLIGNMTANSDFPPAPKKLIEAWEKKFAREWKPVGRKSPKPNQTEDTEPDLDESEQVQTRSNKYKRVRAGQVGLGQGQVGLGQVGSSRAEPDAADGAAARAPDGALSSSRARKEKNAPDRDQTFAEWLGVAEHGELLGRYLGEKAQHILGKLADGRYQASLDFPTDEPEAWTEFAKLIVDTFDQFWDEPYRPLVGDEKFMSAVVNASRKDGRVRKGWMRILNDLRRELKSANGKATAEAQR